MNHGIRVASALIFAVIATGCSYIRWQSADTKREHGNIYIEALDSRNLEFVTNTTFQLTPASDSVSGSYGGTDTRVQYLGVDIGVWRLHVSRNGYGAIDTLVQVRSRCRTNVQVFMAASSCENNCVNSPSRVSIDMCRDSTYQAIPPR